MKENIKKLVNVVESIERDAENNVNKENIKASIDSVIPIIELAKVNPLNAEYELLLIDLGSRIGRVLLLIK